MSAPEVKKRTAAAAVQPEAAPAQATSTPATTTPATPAPQAAPARMSSGAEILRAGAGPVRTDNVMMPSQLAQTRIEVDTPALKAAPAQPSHKDATLPKTRSGNIVDGPVKVEAPSPMPTAADATSLTTRYQPKKWTNEEIYEYLSGFTPKTPEELAKERKRQKREAIISAIGDGISAISNLVYTTKYAPNAYTGKDTLSERNRARWEKARKAYDDDLKAWIHGRMAARKADWDAGQQSAILELKRQEAEGKERDRALKVHAQAMQDRLTDMEIRLKNGQLDKAAAEKALYEIKAAAEKAGIPLKTAKTEAEIRKLNAQAASANAQANKTNSEAAGRYLWYDSNGGEHYAKTEDEARYNSLMNGTWREVVTPEVSERKESDRKGSPIKTVRTQGVRQAGGRSVKPAQKAAVSKPAQKKQTGVKWK